MHDKITQLQAEDFEQAVRFLGKAFGNGEPDWFKINLSTCYRPTNEIMQLSYAVKRNDKIVAMAGAFPSIIHVGDHTLKNVGIGGVSVDESCRRQGLMNLLMNHIADQLRNCDAQVSYLGGLRHRYNFFGWERGGIAQTAQISPECIKNKFGDQPSNITFTDLDNDDSLTIEILKSFHDAQPIYCSRPSKEFHRYLHNWAMTPRIASDGDNQVVGCIVCNCENKTVNELIARDADSAGRILQELVQSDGLRIDLHLPPVRTDISQYIQSFSEVPGITHAGNWQIFDWPATLNALMQLQHRIQPLNPGCVTIKITDRNITLELSVSAGGASCTTTTTRSPDLAITSLQATQLLFGPLKPSAVMPLPSNAIILDAWCPLPLWISRQDCV